MAPRTPDDHIGSVSPGVRRTYLEGVPRRARPADQPAILLAALARARQGGTGAIAAFDLDSTLLDNRPRQAQILREYGRWAGLAPLRSARPEHLEGWDLARAARRAGLSRAEADVHAAPLRRFWEERFFTSEACRLDVPVPGAPEFARAVRASGCRIAYVTGRPAAMEPGTLHVLRRFGFPRPDDAAVFLLMKPGEALRDDAWKVIAREAVERLGRPVLAFDNEPAHVNAYARAWPGALAVHLDTDHSGRPVEVDASIPSVADLRLPEGVELSAGGADATAGAP